MSQEAVEMNSLEKGRNEEDKESIKSPSLVGVRHLQVLMSFFLIFIAYGIRVNLSVGIVAMTDNRTTLNPDIPTYPEWTDKSVMQSSFFWGYIIPQIGAGQLAKRYGPKWFLITAMTVCSLFGFLVPWMAAVMGSRGVMMCRSIQGFCQGFIFPSVHHLLSKWVPLSERSRMGTFVYAGGSLGTVISMIISGLISASWWGWPAVFYLYSGSGFVWALAMAVLGSNSPSQHSSITKEEIQYIEQGIKGDSMKLATPWKSMITSLPVWALLVTHCGQNWGFWTLMTEIPTYMSKILNFDIKANSFLSALPYLMLWLLSFFFGILADCFIVKKWSSIGAARKLFNSIGLFIPAVALMALGYVTQEHKIFAVVLLVIAVGTNSAIYCGFNVNHIDLSPNHSGTMMGITNCISNICSLLAPLLVQVVVTDEEDPHLWRMIFFIASGIYISTNLVFVFFGSGEVQPWNDDIQITDKNDELNHKPPPDEKVKSKEKSHENHKIAVDELKSSDKDNEIIRNNFAANDMKPTEKSNEMNNKSSDETENSSS